MNKLMLTLGLFGVLVVSTALTQGSAHAAQTSNGFGMNGFGMNGFGMNGFGMNGFGMNGFGMNGFGMNGFGMNGFGMNGFGMNGFGMNGFGMNGLVLGHQDLNARAVIRTVSGIDPSRSLSAAAKR